MSKLITRFPAHASTIAIMVLLSACGSDGKDGAQGEKGERGNPGTPAPIGITLKQASTITTEITSVTLDATSHLPKIQFTLKDGNGTPVRGLTNKDIASVSYGRMGTEDEVGTTDLPGKARKIWLSYYNQENEAKHIQGTDHFQGSSCNDCLVDNHDGSYSLKINKPINTLNKFVFSNSADTGVFLTLTHDALRKASDSYYWIPETKTAIDAPHKLIDDNACTSCHRAGEGGEFGRNFGPHSGQYTNVESCNFCHTDYSQKSVDGKVQDLSLKGLTHYVHSTYIGASYTNATVEHDTVPQSSANCQKCHTDTVDDTFKDLWKADLDSAACVACHYDDRILGSAKLNTLDIKALPDWHWDQELSQINTNMINCVQCHNDKTGGQRGAERAHYTQNANKNTAKIEVTLDTFNWNPKNKSLTLTASFMQDGVKLPLSKFDGMAKYWDLYGEYSYGSFIFNGFIGNDLPYGINWITRKQMTQTADGTVSMTIYDHSTAPDGVLGYPLEKMIDEKATFAIISRIRPCMNKLGELIECTYSEGDTKVPNSAKLTPGIRTPYTLQTPQYFKFDGTKVTESPRAQFMSMEKDCNQCHDSRINSPQPDHLDGCVICHSVAWRGKRDDIPGKGDINGPILRTSQVAHYKHWDVTFADGKPFLGIMNCKTCHTESGSLNLAQLLENTLDPYPFHAKTNEATAENRKAQGLPAEMIDQRYVSPQAGACMTCHLPARTGPNGEPMLTQSTIAHMEGMGAIVDHDGDITTLGVPMDTYKSRLVNGRAPESCGTCHDEENLLKVHNNN